MKSRSSLGGARWGFGVAVWAGFGGWVWLCVGGAVEEVDTDAEWCTVAVAPATPADDGIDVETPELDAGDVVVLPGVGEG